MSQAKTTTSKQAAVSGKRRLEFEDGSRALLNKKFFLDLEGKLSEQIEEELTMRGAKVEKFFNRDIKYMVTSRPRDDTRSTPSPLTPSQKGGVSLKSPLESVSPRPQDTANKPVTRQQCSRAAMMLAASKKKTGSKKTVDVIAMAKSWGCKVISVDALLAELKKLKPLPQRTSGGGNGRAGRVHVYQTPYVKVEDHSKGYRPLVRAVKTWPRASADTPPNGCPFDTPRKRKSTTRSRSSRGTHSPSKPNPHSMVTRLKRSGYCECCTVRFEDLTMHLRSGKHLEYANDDSNFTKLDSLISRGTRYSELISRLRSRARSPAKSSPVRRSPRRDVVRLVTPPSPYQPTTSKRTKTTPTRQSPRKRLQSPRGRKSPRFHLVRDGMTLRHSPQKRITLPNGVYTSLKTGELRITPTPLKSPVRGKEYTPGFATPVINSPRQDIKATPPRLGRKRALKSPDESCTKRVRMEECVPETPEKRVTRSSPRSTMQLCNLDVMLERACVSPTKVRDLVTRGSTSATGNFPSPRRRSPRLNSPQSLVVSYNLRQLKSATPTTSRPISFEITPEIALQGDLPASKWSSGLSESPITNLQLHHLFESSYDAEGNFNGFSPSVRRQAWAQIADSKAGDEGKGKRARSAEVSVGNIVSPESRRRKAAARKSPRGH